MKLTNKEIKGYLKAFEENTEVKVEDDKEYLLNSNLGYISVTFDLSGYPSIFTRLVSDKSGFDMFKGFEDFGFNPNTGKNNFFSSSQIEDFIYRLTVSFDIKAQDKKELISYGIGYSLVDIKKAS